MPHCMKLMRVIWLWVWIYCWPTVPFERAFASPESDVERAPVVVVVGAGISGLAAARELEARGYNVVILEAHDWIGGRMKTAGKLDLGGTYLHGSSLRNSLWWLIQEKFPHIQTAISGGTSTNPGFSSAQWRFQGKILSQPQVDKAILLMNEWHKGIHEHLEKLHFSLPEDEAPTILAKLAEKVMDEMRSKGLLSTELDEALLSFQLQAAFQQDRGLSFEEHSVEGFANDWDWIDYAGPDHIFVHGTQSLIKALAKDIHGPIHLGHPVTRIRYSENGCTVETLPGGVFQCSACVVTVPLGVLKEGHKTMFDPHLPCHKQKALERAGVAAFNTILIEWDQDISVKGSQYILGNTDSENPLKHGFVCPGVWKEGYANITQFYVEGSEFPFDDDSFWKDQAVLVMKEVFSERGLDLDNIVGVLVTKWHEDPHFRGSYSTPSTQTRGNEDRRILAEPVDNVLFFAGEHTNTEGRYQSMDGAYDTGVLAAAQLAEAVCCLPNDADGNSHHHNPHQLKELKKLTFPTKTIATSSFERINRFLNPHLLSQTRWFSRESGQGAG